MIKRIYEENGRLKCDGCFYTGIENDGTPPKPRVGSWVKYKRENCYAIVTQVYPADTYMISWIKGNNEIQDDVIPIFCSVLVSEGGIELLAP